MKFNFNIFLLIFFFNCSDTKDIINLSLAGLIKNSPNNNTNVKVNQETDNQFSETAPTNLKTTQTSDGIILSWNKVKDKNGKEFASYQVSIDNGVSWEETQDTFYIFKKLNKNQKYNLKVRPNGNKNLTATISITIGDNPPTKPQRLQVFQTEENFITISWEASEDKDNDPISYQVSKDSIKWTDIGKKTSWTFQNLIPKTTYIFQVRGTTQKSDGEAASIKATTNKISINFDIDFEEISMNWTKVMGATDYEVWISSNPVYQSTSNKTNWTFQNLELNQDFTIKIRVKSIKGSIITEETIITNNKVWNKLPLSWKNLLANNVNSIPNNIEERKGPLPEKLTVQQIKDVMNLEEIIYNCYSSFKRCYESYKGSENYKVRDLTYIKHFKNLKKIHLHANLISNNANTEIKHEKLEELDLKRNKLKTIPHIVTSLTNLKVLKLKFNEIKKISNSINKLSNLKVLDISHNRIEKIADDVQLINLERLDLGHNYLFFDSTKILGMFNLTNLQILLLNDNDLGNISSRIDQFANLQTLELSRNEITSLPNTFKNLNNLTSLYLGFQDPRLTNQQKNNIQANLNANTTAYFDRDYDSSDFFNY